MTVGDSICFSQRFIAESTKKNIKFTYCVVLHINPQINPLPTLSPSATSIIVISIVIIPATGQRFPRTKTPHLLDSICQHILRG
jgi:hypothetical protein